MEDKAGAVGNAATSMGGAGGQGIVNINSPMSRALAKKLSRRAWEARARISLSMRHGQNEHDRSVKLEARKSLEKRLRGKGLSAERKQRRKKQVEFINARVPWRRSTQLNSRFGDYTEAQATARRKRQMENYL